MKALLFAVVLLASLLTAWSTPSDGKETLTNQSIVEMVKGGLSERVILARIRTGPTNFDTRTDALIALKKSGVPEKVIEAMMSPSAPAAAPAGSSAPAGGVAMTPPAAAPGLSRPTVYQVVAGKEVELLASGTEVQRTNARYSRSTEVVIAGNKSKHRTTERQPVFVITGAPSEIPLVKLDPGKNDRNLKVGSGSHTPYAGSTSTRGIRGEDMIDITIERDSRGFYRVKPKAPLAPGEYGFVVTRGGSPMGSSIYDFGVD